MNTFSNHKPFKPLFKSPLWLISHLGLGLGLILWFMPITHSYCQAVDVWVFKIFNGSLVDHPLWQKFWGILNHRKETSLNLIIAALFNLLIILATKDKVLRQLRIKQTLYFWICFQIGFMLQDYFFNTFLKIERLSPSLVISPVLKLSEILHNPQIKDTSTHSFPGGHAFALIYWGSFTYLISQKRLGLLGLSFAIFLCLPRLFSGAHWFSDVLFSSLLALIWLSYTFNTAIYRYILR